jgi:hypothetical protein
MGQPDSSFITAEVSHANFVRGLPVGRYRVIVNPERARKYMQGRLLVKLVCLPILGLGAALAIAGQVLWAIPFVAIGFLVPRMVKRRAPEMLLYLAQRDAAVYRDAVEQEILEVRVHEGTINPP